MYVHGKNGRSRTLEAARFPSETWNVYNSVLNGDQRTSNTMKGWHNKFQKLMVVHHLSIWIFAEVLKDE